MEIDHVDGKDRGFILLYALSTCSWCKKTKELLIELGVAFDYIYVDLLPDDEMQEMFKKVMEYNPRCSFPTLIINERCIAGFREMEIREALADG
jgi:glutaredoxin-like protein NrdH